MNIHTQTDIAFLVFGVLDFVIGVCCLFGVFVLFWCWVFGGACETFLFEKLHAQFAYYKSPEHGLNLSGS